MTASVAQDRPRLRPRRIQCTRYEMRRLRLIAAQVVGRRVLDIGHAQLANPYLAAPHRVGFDMNAAPGPAPAYEEEILGDVAEIDRILNGRLFDTVIAAEFIEHVENPYGFLRRVRNVLAPDGRLILSTPNPLGFPVALFEALQVKSFFYTEDHLYYLLPRWVDRLLERCGFRVEGHIPVGLWTPFGGVPLCPEILSYQIIYTARRD